MRVAAVLVPVLLIAGAVYNRATFGTFAFWQVPGRIDFCGRQYLRGSTVAEIPADDWSLVPATTVYPMWWHVYEKQPRQGGVADPDVPGLPCTMGLVLRLHDGDYVQYALSGGP
jgi:hypothetical protein